MIKNNRAFSLIEILLVLGIIAVVVAMGISLSKKQTQNAYNRYIYPAYINLQDAIADANSNNLSIIDAANNNRVNDANSNNLSIIDAANNNRVNVDFVTHINSLFSGTLENQGFATPTPITIITKNGIEYEFYKPQYNATLVRDGQSYSCYLIKILIPASPGKRFMYVAYLPDFRGGVLIPTGEGYLISREQVGTVDAHRNDTGVTKRERIDDIHTRADLLPFYIDDGLTGRNAANSAQLNQYNKTFDYTDATTAYCRVYGSFQINNNLFYDCNGMGNPNENLGIIRVADPYKVF